jgi:hypothetical protein
MNHDAYISGKGTIERDRDEEFLAVEITLTCTACGDVVLLLDGRHLRPLVRICQQLIATAPDHLTEAGNVEEAAACYGILPRLEPH